MKKALSYLVSWYYKLTYPLRKVKTASFINANDLHPETKPWIWEKIPMEEEIHGPGWRGQNKTYFLYGRFHFLVVPRRITGSHKNVCPWMLNLDFGKVQEIDVVEFMNEKAYVGIYHNSKSSEYFRTERCSGRWIKRVVYKKFQIKKAKCGYISGYYSVEWTPKRVKWYHNGIPIAVAYHYVPVQPLYLVLTGLDMGSIEEIRYERIPGVKCQTFLGKGHVSSFITKHHL